MNLSDELLRAASKGMTDDIDRLLKLGANPNFRDVLEGATCLHRSVGKNNVTMTRLLLARGADPNIVTENTSTSPLGIAALNGSLELVELLLAVGARLSDRELNTALLVECRELGFGSIAELIEASVGA